MTKWVLMFLAGLATAPGVLANTVKNSAVQLYVYELPDGSRIVSDHVLTNKNYRLVRTGTETRGMGQLAAGQNSQFFRADPDAYDALIRRHAADQQLDFALVKAIMHVESGFNPYARSDRGALGLMQVKPDTAKRHGVHDVYDPDENIRAGVRHLKWLAGQFDNKLYLMLAAYNAGENAVRRHRGIPPYEETQAYVRKVLSLKRQYAKANSISKS